MTSEVEAATSDLIDKLAALVEVCEVLEVTVKNVRCSAKVLKRALVDSLEPTQDAETARQRLGDGYPGPPAYERGP